MEQVNIVTGGNYFEVLYYRDSDDDESVLGEVENLSGSRCSPNEGSGAGERISPSPVERFKTREIRSKQDPDANEIKYICKFSKLILQRAVVDRFRGTITGRLSPKSGKGVSLCDLLHADETKCGRAQRSKRVFARSRTGQEIFLRSTGRTLEDVRFQKKLLTPAIGGKENCSLTARAEDRGTRRRPGFGFFSSPEKGSENMNWRREQQKNR